MVCCACSCAGPPRSDGNHGVIECIDRRLDLVWIDCSELLNGRADSFKESDVVDAASAIELDSAELAEVKCECWCVVGDVECKYGDKAVIECKHIGGCEKSCGQWGQMQFCQFGTACIADLGCVCASGTCYGWGRNVVECGHGQPEMDSEFVCIDGCCVLSKISPPGDANCYVDSDCIDCIRLVDGDTFSGAKCYEVNGLIPNLCTIDWCVAWKCWHLDKVSEGACEDGNEATVDSCDPVSGNCLHDR